MEGSGPATGRGQPCISPHSAASLSFLISQETPLLLASQ